MTIESTGSTPTPNLCAGLVLAQRAAKAVAKDATNQHFRYRYASSEDVIVAAREALSVGDLALYAESHTLEVLLPAVPGERGESGWLVEPADPILSVRVRYVLVHSSGEMRLIESSTPLIPEKGRPYDKALAAAKTYDLAYVLRTLLLLPRGEAEADGVDSRDDSAWQRGGGRQRDDRREPPRQSARAPERAQEQAPVAPPAPTPAPAAGSEAVRAWLGQLQGLGWGRADLGNLIREVCGAPRQPRDMTELERAAVLAEARTRGAPPREDDEAQRIMREARAAAAEDIEARRAGGY